MKIWHRYLFSHLAKTFLFLLFCLFTLYVTLDLSAHGVRFIASGKTGCLEITLYYLRNFAKHLELFFPLTFLLSSLKVLFQLNSHSELVALQMAGLPRKTLLGPFFIFAAILSLLAYANSQWFSPDAHDAIDAFRIQHSGKKKKIKKEHLYHLALNDHSEIIYQSFDKTNNELFDVFWIRNGSDIWHMKFLKIHLEHPIGRYVDHLQRNPQGQFEKTESFIEIALSQLHWNDHVTLERFIPLENRSLSTLLQQASALAVDRPIILSHLHYKLALPMLPFLILFAIGPLVMRPNKKNPTFLIALISIAALIGLVTVLDGMLILGENRVIPAYLAIWSPIALIALFLIRPFAKL